jgi:predicted ATPase
MMATGSPIRTPDQRLRIFVSSTLQELAEERCATREAIQSICLTPVMFELGARAHPPRDLYRAYLAQSDVFVGIYWERYGWIAPNESISGLEDEYVLAGRLPKLVYIKDSSAREARLAQLIDKIQRDDAVSYRPFRNSAELRSLVQNDLALMLTERFAQAGGGSAEPAAPVLDAPPRWLAPVERGELIGRDAETRTIAELLVREDVGCVTLTGAGGTGKTRLAIHMAQRLGVAFPDGVFYVPLASVRTPEDVVPAIVSTLELPVPPTGADPARLLAGFLGGKRSLLVLDNFEQVLPASVEIGRLLGTCRHLKVMVTSREALRIRGERELAIPPLGHEMTPGSRTPAMALFEQRAREIRPGFAVDDSNRSAVAEICRRLDALPLAIELAAARIRVLSPQAMLPRLDRSLSLLTGGSRDLPARQQTLRGALDWSHELLSADERAFFRRLGVFTGGFSEDAAAAAVGDTPLAVLDGLTSLVEKSLLVRAEVSDTVRFHLLETVREFALEQLTDAGEDYAARVRHATWVRELLAQSHAPLAHATRRFARHDLLSLEEGNIQAALRFLRTPQADGEMMWDFYCQLAWARHSELRGREIADTFAAMKVRGESSDPVRAATARGLAAWATSWTATGETLAELEAAVAVLEAAGDRAFLPGIITAWGTALSALAPARALPVLDRAIGLAVETEQHTIESWARMMRCLFFMMNGDLAAADRAAGELVAAATRHDEQEGISFGMTAKGRLQLMRGELSEARDSFAQAVAWARARSGVYARVDALQSLGGVMLLQGDEASARAVFEELLMISAARNGVTAFELVWGTMAGFLARDGELERARQVLEVIPTGCEDLAPALAMQLDPTGMLAARTREARTLLGGPPALDPARVDVDAALRAALGPRGRE